MAAVIAARGIRLPPFMEWEMPRQAADGTVRAAITIRTATDLKDRLEAAAKQNNRTVGHEAESRLIKSFAETGVLNEANWSDTTRNIARMVGLVLNQIDTLDGREWCDTPEGIEAAQAGVAAVLDISGAPGNRVPRRTGAGDVRRAETLKGLAVALGRHLNMSAEASALQRAYDEV